VSDLAERFKKVAAAALADSMGSLNVLDPEINPVVPGVKMAGPAFTVKAYPGSIITVHHALMEAAPGDVIVVDNEGAKGGAMFGELMARDCVLRKLGGMVIDGPVRDVEGIRELGFPTYARYCTPRVATNRRLGKIQVPVTCGGVVVNPGDWVVGDEDGVVTIPRDQAEELLAAAEAVEEKEDRYASRMDAGEFIADLTGLSELIRAQLNQ